MMNHDESAQNILARHGSECLIAHHPTTTHPSPASLHREGSED